ncbi:MAG: hypothetical protein K0Q49_2500 [Haloplasmataceae bacterium]|nr:hypothetical protein [Haloplasmataceae bacterium]
MRKKYYSFSFILLLSLLITIVSTANKLKQVDKTTSNPESILFNDNELIENTFTDNLVFDDRVEIIDIIEIDSEYIAIGSKDGYPYMQPLKMVDNKLEMNEKIMDFTNLSGNITNVIRKNYFLTATIEDESTQDFFVSYNKIIPFYKKQINLNYSKYVTMTPEYIVIHETNNTNIGADANAHYRYWNTNPDAEASTHFVVDNKQVYQMLELDQVAWHVGDNRNYSDITNLNSIGIEIAVNADGNYEEARLHTIELTIQLMKELNMDISQLKRHYDASGKICPLRMIEDPSLWDDFVNQVKIGIEN